MTDVPSLKQAIFKGARSRSRSSPSRCVQQVARVCVIMCHVTVQGLSHAVRKEAWKFLLGYFPWDSTLEERKVLHRAKTYGPSQHAHIQHTPVVT